MRSAFRDDSQSELWINLNDYLRLDSGFTRQIESPHCTARVPTRQRLILAIFGPLRQGAAEDVVENLGVSIDDFM